MIAEAETSRTATELQVAKITGANTTKHSSEQYQELHKIMESTKQDYIEQRERHNTEENIFKTTTKTI